jgi:hypothetical protein
MQKGKRVIDEHAEMRGVIIGLDPESFFFLHRIKLCHCRNPDLTDQVCHPQIKDFQVLKQLTLFQS